MRPMGTDTRKIHRQLRGARTPPSTRPMNVPLNAAAWFTPSAMPRLLSGNTSVRMAAELAMSMAAPTPWKMRMTISHTPAAWPVIHVIDSINEKNVKTAKPKL